MKRFSHAIVTFLSVPFFVAFVGCGGDPRGTVSGTVTYKGKALPGGTVVFITEDNAKQDRVPIKSDGTYSSANVPLGNVRVAVEPAPKGASGNMPKGAKKPEMPADSPAAQVYGQSGANYVDIPMSLRNPATSDLKLKVESGEQKFDIPLKDSK